MKTPKKRVLVLYKRSSLSTSGRFAKKIPDLERFRANHIKHYQTLREVLTILRAIKVDFKKANRTTPVDYRAFDLILTVGGDGTFLEAARNAHDRQTILGINSDTNWSIGQFCHANSKNLKRQIERAIDGAAKTQKIYKLRIILQNGKVKTQTECLNDVLICHANPAAMSRYNIKIGSIDEEHRDSGLWIASAAGSTGAILSAGGKKLPEKIRDFQYRPRELYKIRGVNYRHTGNVLSPKNKIIVLSQMQGGRLFIDGSHVHYPFPYGSKATISASPNHINMIHG